jgi:hypothetical protein
MFKELTLKQFRAHQPLRDVTVTRARGSEHRDQWSTGNTVECASVTAEIMATADLRAREREGGYVSSVDIAAWFRIPPEAEHRI